MPDFHETRIGQQFLDSVRESLAAIETNSAPPTRYEYRCRKLSDSLLMDGTPGPELHATLENFGSQGFRWIRTDNDLMIFERALP